MSEVGLDRKYDEHGPHGGTWVVTDDGFVEISVFETNAPPRFRLFFFDPAKQPQAPSDGEVTIETLRPDGAKQLFRYRREADYLESDSEIPEPHQFTVKLAIPHDGHTHTYQAQFTEEGHQHGGGAAHEEHGGGDHGHAHGGADHGHEHGGSGFFGWLRGLYGHSHSVVEKTDSVMESSEQGIRALKISLVGLGLTAALQLVVVLISGSVALLADTIHNFADAGTSIPLWIAFALARRGASRRYTYGYGKVEDVACVLIVLIIFFSACVAAYESIRKIIHPQSVTQLGWVAVAAIVGFLGNEAVAIFRIRVGKQIGSAALIADGQHARVDGFTSLAVLIGVAGVYFGLPILDPIIGVLIIIAILFIVKDAARAVWIRLIDGIEPEILAQIEHAPRHGKGVTGVHDVRARWLGHRVYSDVAINVDPMLSVKEADVISKKVEKALHDHVRLLGSVVIRVCPSAKNLATV